ncbi:peptidoglycan-binding protein [Calothrix sp. PCC 7507]|uniref:peptidoglycan-binding domain-containing protein n=1 Tax=Calothrix sp. PCC 7507 TaxID=99598 RepID=UPI00029EF8AD|nr:peptidoglycan-binding domain-containing protein [Calothrix sp. PCC 7507]AFY35815.1 Peptidoglycan-binding domain 1 protein [Calothrix sp. PCC 7507]
MNARTTSNPTLPNLRFGDSGDAVRVLQRLLLNNRYSVKLDGSFGAVTETAVKAFQNQRNLLADGIVGSRTWRELIQ